MGITSYFIVILANIWVSSKYILSATQSQSNVTFPELKHEYHNTPLKLNESSVSNNRSWRLQDGSPAVGNALLHNSSINVSFNGYSDVEDSKWVIRTTIQKFNTAEPDLLESPDLEINATGTNLWKVCGRTPLLLQRIVGGEDARFGELPWLVSLRRIDGSLNIHKCGAVLLHPEWVITAAHCVHGIRRKSIRLRLGAYNFENDPMRTTDPQNKLHVTEVELVRIFIHPDFNSITFENDLALLKLKNAIHLDSNVIPVCLAPVRDYAGTYVTAAGWGALSSGGNTSLQLEKVRLPVITKVECESWYDKAGTHQVIESEFICTGFANGKKDTCQGDSGGPLIQEILGRWALIGVVSWGMGCARPGVPGVNTLIPLYNQWIMETTANEVTLPSFYENS